MVKIDRHLKNLLLTVKTTLKKGVLVTSITLLNAYYLWANDLTKNYPMNISTYAKRYQCIEIHLNIIYIIAKKKKKKSQKLKILLNCYKYKMKYYTLLQNVTQPKTDQEASLRCVKYRKFQNSICMIPFV